MVQHNRWARWFQSALHFRQNIYNEIKFSSLINRYRIPLTTFWTSTAKPAPIYSFFPAAWKNRPSRNLTITRWMFFSNTSPWRTRNTLSTVCALKNVVSALEHQDEYKVFFTVVNENGEFSYKKPFSPVDDKPVYNLFRLDISGIVKRYERQIGLIRKEKLPRQPDQGSQPQFLWIKFEIPPDFRRSRRHRCWRLQALQRHLRTQPRR